MTLSYQNSHVATVASSIRKSFSRHLNFWAQNLETQKMSKKSILDYIFTSERDVEESNGSSPIKRRKQGKKINTPDSSKRGVTTTQSKSTTQASTDVLFSLPKESDQISQEDTQLNSTLSDSPDTVNNDSKNWSTSEFPRFLQSSQSTQPKEERYSFLLEIRDQNGRKPDDPEYDPSTLYIPDDAFNKLTPFEKQFWDIKRKHFDTVILFKKGKFYELYESDAELVAKLFDFRITDRVNMKMSGFPEKSYTQWASKLLELGYKIGRVEQVESGIGKRIREREGPKQAAEKLVKRELTEIVTSGTIYDLDYLSNSNPIYIGSLVLKFNKLNSKLSDSYNTLPDNTLYFSLILYDASINRVYYTEFEDSPELDTLKTILVQRDIRELLVKPSSMVHLAPLAFLLKETKVIRPDTSDSSSIRKYEFPSDELFVCFKQLYNYMDSLCRGEALEFSEISVLQPPESMSLDTSTLTSLDILSNNYDGSDKHSLFVAINYCVTPMGERMLRRWLLGPLTDIAKIKSRHRESALLEQFDFSEFSQRIIPVGDLERRLGRVNNPNPTLKSLCSLLDSLKGAVAFLEYVVDGISGGEREIESTTNSPDGIVRISMIRRCNTLIESTKSIIARFMEAYVIEGEEIVPGSSNTEMENLNREIGEIEEEFKVYLESLKEKTGFQGLCYKNINKDIFQVEAPVGVVMPTEFSVVSMTKTHRRYYSPHLRSLVKRREEVEERLFQIRGNTLRLAVESIKSFKEHIYDVAGMIATLDCYASFMKFATSHTTALPEFVEWGSGRELQVSDMLSPVYPRHVRNNFTPEKKITIITGPNMGGKSTFLRSIALNIILAQMGMRVTAMRLQLPLFDRIFTRIGASDSLARGESTFMKELLETSKILNQGTSRSFVIIDELGRGTSTEDGAAIARAVLDYLYKLGPYVLFSTHYHALVSDYCNVDKAYVDSIVENGDIVFLYKIRSGVCLSSQGLEIAKLAGIPEKIVEAARNIKRKLEGGV